MYRAIDTNRDQSYFLFNTTRDQLNFLRFPLGNLLKKETREIAKELQLNVWAHQSILETHTVETHIHRLRKKIKEIFNDESFIISSKDGYSIN